MDRAPDGIEPIVGYRAWLLLGGGYGALHPLNLRGAAGHTWNAASTGWIVASCARDGRLPGVDGLHGQVPEERCSCGFYALKSLFTLRRGLAEGNGLRPYLVLGRVLLAGKIIEHTLGYRAQRARIVDLIPIAGSEKRVELTAHALGLPIGDSVRPPDWWYTPPTGPSSVTLRVKQWVCGAAPPSPASAPRWLTSRP